MRPAVWKMLAESVQGTAHRERAQPCQDSCLAQTVGVGDAQTLIAVCADGAGSAAQAERGAKLVCASFARLAGEALAARGGRVTGLSRDHAVDWCRQVQQSLQWEAGVDAAALRDLACTLLAAVVGHDAAVFVQVGDGAIVVRDDQTYRPVFWPQTGEYHNLTHFVTDEDATDHVCFDTRPGRVEELALLSDGLQLLALEYGTRTAHAAFFQPVFATLRAATDPAALAPALRAFLDSPRVNQRSDDDKTLVLALRD